MKYLLESNLVDAVVLPKLVVKKGLAFGIWHIVTNPETIPMYSGSVYAPTYGLGRILEYALKKYRRIAITAIPCHAKAIRKITEYRGRSKDVFIIGLYCFGTPNMLATKYALKYFGIHYDNIESFKFRGFGWPGFVSIKMKNKKIYIPYTVLWSSGFGQYFYGPVCYLCTDHTNRFSDISLADPSTLSNEHVQNLGGASLIIVRNIRGLDILQGAIRAGYIKALEIDPVFAIQYGTILKLSKKVLKKGMRYKEYNYMLPPGFTTIVHEMLFNIGGILARRERLWPLLKVFHRVIARTIYSLIAIMEHNLLRTRWSKIYSGIACIQRLKALKCTPFYLPPYLHFSFNTRNLSNKETSKKTC